MVIFTSAGCRCNCWIETRRSKCSCTYDKCTLTIFAVVSGLIYTLSDGCDCICWLGFTCRKASNIESNRKNMILGRKACQSCLLIHQDFQYRTRQNFLEGIPGEKCSEKEEGMLAMLVFPLFFFFRNSSRFKRFCSSQHTGPCFHFRRSPVFFQVLSG